MGRCGRYSADPKRRGSSSPKIQRPPPWVDDRKSIRRLIGKQLTVEVHFYETARSTFSCRMACYFPSHQKTAKATPNAAHGDSGATGRFQPDTQAEDTFENKHAHFIAIHADLQKDLPKFSAHLQSKISKKLGVEDIRDFDRNILATVPLHWKTGKSRGVVDLLKTTTLGKGCPISVLDEIETKVVRSLHGPNTLDIQIGDQIMICDVPDLQPHVRVYEVIQFHPSLVIERKYPTGASYGRIREIITDWVEKTLCDVLESADISPRPRGRQSPIYYSREFLHWIRLRISNADMDSAGPNGTISMKGVSYTWSLTSSWPGGFPIHSNPSSQAGAEATVRAQRN
ncbi:hypothetical protein V8F20_006858 [Naviculisporaceae sp. PSN 640]